MRTWKFSLYEGKRLYAVPTDRASAPLEFSNGSWGAFRSRFVDLWDSKPITESEAMRITSGVKPETK